MSLIPFYMVDAQLAGEETRVLTFRAPYRGIPAGRYDLVEYFCPNPACDCRRGMLNVVEERDVERFLASISYAFDPDDPDAGPFLDPLNPQSHYAPAFLAVVEEIVFTDANYLARLERHYSMMKAAASDPTHPAYARLQHAITTAPDRFLSPRDGAEPDRVSDDVVRRNVGRNEPCPCGSGRKYKHCCGRRGRR
jgi:hypothetical protein